MLRETLLRHLDLASREPVETGSGGGPRAAPMGTERWWLLLCLALSEAAVDTGEWERPGGKCEAREAAGQPPSRITQGERSQSLLSPRGERLSG